MSSGKSANPQLCALCLSVEPLVLSHGMPAGVYRLLGPAVENGPISYAGSDGWKPLTRQDKRPLLCRECETTFAKSEDWVLRRAPRRGKFPLHDVLRNKPPDYRWPGIEVYSTRNRPAIDVGHVCRFAMSIFWRYSVASWPSGHSVRLGPYTEEIRSHLRGGPAPKTARLLCHLSRLTSEYSAIMMPTTVKADGFLLHQFIVPGFDFMLAVGRSVPVTFAKFCLLSSDEKPIVVSERSEARRQGQMLRTMDAADAYQTSVPASKNRWRQ